MYNYVQEEHLPSFTLLCDKADPIFPLQSREHNRQLALSGVTKVFY